MVKKTSAPKPRGMSDEKIRQMQMTNEIFGGPPVTPERRVEYLAEPEPPVVAVVPDSTEGTIDQMEEPDD